MAYGMADVVQRRRMIDEGAAAEEIKRIERGKLTALLPSARRHPAGVRRFWRISARAIPAIAAIATPASTRSRPGTARKPRSRRLPPSTAPASVSAPGISSMCCLETAMRRPSASAMPTCRFSGWQRSAGADLAIGLSPAARLRPCERRSRRLRGPEAGAGCARRLQARALRLLPQGPADLGAGCQIRQDAAARERAALGGEEAALFEVLRKLEPRSPRRANVPPYVVFPDTTLIGLAKARPQP